MGRSTFSRQVGSCKFSLALVEPKRKILVGAKVTHDGGNCNTCATKHNLIQSCIAQRRGFRRLFRYLRQATIAKSTNVSFAGHGRTNGTASASSRAASSGGKLMVSMWKAATTWQQRARQDWRQSNVAAAGVARAKSGALLSAGRVRTAEDS